jgi:serine/threonine protein kinase
LQIAPAWITVRFFQKNAVACRSRNLMITVGTRLGPYEILSQLGAGGMGEVYRAKIMRLDRIAAKKAETKRTSALPRRSDDA